MRDAATRRSARALWGECLLGGAIALLAAGTARAQVNTPAQPNVPQAPDERPATGAPAVGPSAPDAATPSPPTDSGEVGDIVVTAQRRSERLQDVPIAITALNSKTLSIAGISSTADLKALAPGLNFNSALAGYGQPRIRGVGTTAQGPGIENPVATYVDGVYIASPSGAIFTLNDIDQVAVLKGPQGTLFGRNATGGLIQVTTRTPDSSWTGDVQGSYGNYGTYAGNAYVGGPLTETLGASIAGFYEKQKNGFGVNVATGQDIQTHETVATRGKLRFAPTDSTRFTLAGDYQNYRAADPAYRVIGNNIFGGTSRGGPRDVELDVQPVVRTRNWGGSLTAQHDFAGAQLMSITAYRESRLFTRFEADGTPASLLNLEITQRDKQVSQELQLLSTGTGPLRYVFGLYYFYADQRYDPSRTYGGFISGGDVILETTQKLNSYAAFGQATYALGERTNLTAGLRYTIDQRSLFSTETFRSAFGSFPVFSPNDADKSFRKLTWRVSLDNRLTPELLGYVSYNRGFKGGSFTAMAFPYIILLPETLDAFEAGFKSDLFDRKVRFNLAAFYYDYKNIQVNQIQNGLLFVYNGKGAHSYGVDADLQVALTRRFRINAGASLLHARYTDFPAAFRTTPIRPTFPPPPLPAQNGGNAVGTIDASGNRLQNTPDMTFNIGASYELATAAGSFTLAANEYHNGGYFTAPENRLKQRAYDVLDASITWTSPDTRYSVKLWGRNLTDTLYTTQIDATNFSDSRGLAAPRTYGVTAGLHF